MARAPQPPAAKKPPAKRPARPATPKPVRPKGLAHARWLGDFPKLSAAEKRLVECCARGEAWEPEGWDGKRPETATAVNTIRAELIRFLALGGDEAHPVHEEGVMVGGGWVVGVLDLHHSHAVVRLGLNCCSFAEVPVFIEARLPELALRGSKLPGLEADRVRVTGSIFLGDGFAATGVVRLVGAEIGSDLACVDGTFTKSDGFALIAADMKVTGNVFLTGEFTANGAVRLSGAEIGGSLECTKGTFTNTDGNALDAEGIRVTGSVFLCNEFAATGEVRLLGAEIGGSLECTKGTFTNTDGNALNADGLKVAGGVFLRNEFAATGEVRLLGAEIGGNLECDNSAFTNPSGTSLSADSIKVTGNVFLRGGFTATGTVRLTGAKVGGSLSCVNGTFTNAGGNAVSADGIKVTGNVFLRKAKVEGAIRMPSARIGTLEDDDACWAAGDHILDGLHYDRIIGPTDAEARIRWLERQHASQLDSRDWKPQPWEQLIKTLREMGHPLEATKVAIAKQERMRRAGKVGGPFAQLLHWFYGFLAGYGYRPLKTVRAMVVVWLLAAAAFHFGSQSGYLGPTTPLYNSPALSGQVEQQCGHGEEKGKTPWTRCPAMPAEYTTFQPFLYSLDLILPLVDLQQEADWAPIVEDPPGNTLPFGAFLRWLMWFEILFGWAMSLMLVAVLGKLVNKD
jgi:hypothetical protein